MNYLVGCKPNILEKTTRTGLNPPSEFCKLHLRIGKIKSFVQINTNIFQHALILVVLDSVMETVVVGSKASSTNIVIACYSTHTFRTFALPTSAPSSRLPSSTLAFRLSPSGARWL
jgi:hypothetical protein